MQITIYQETARDKIEQLQSKPSNEGKGKATGGIQGGQAAFVYQRNSEMLYSQNKTAKKHDLANLRNLSETDFQNQQDYMTLMSNILSEEDYAELAKEGFDPNSMEPDETVTILDHIKVQLAASGKAVVGFNDDLAPEALQEVFGSEAALAEAVSKELAETDVPVTEETLDQVKVAWDMAVALEIPQDGAYRYLVDNELPPEIYSFYVAKSSGSQAILPGNAKYFSQDIEGYYGLSSEGSDGIEKQIDRVIDEAGLERNDEVREEANWLVNQSLPVTPEKLRAYHELRQLEFPVSAEHFSKAVCAALEEGKSPVQANLAQTESVYREANQLINRYLEVEKVRLEMTAQANLHLLKSGFSFDTASMEEIVEALQKAKSDLAAALFPEMEGIERAAEAYSVWEATNEIIADLPGMPLASVGTLCFEEVTTPTLPAFHSSALQMKEQYQRAGEAYETLMTSPRADLGDSIQKAFSNVDELLTDLGMEITEENQRGLRMLGYSRMELTTENLTLVKDAYQMVSKVIEKMTPASTLKMIRDGINPLEQSFEQLQTYFDAEESETENAVESYSRFLYQLEQKNQITPEERESYIGIYRLLNQIEAGDNATIGTLVNMQGEMTFSNLLSALRTRRVGHMDVRLDQEFGTTESVVEAPGSISKQIDTAYIAQLKQELQREVESKESAALYEKYQYEDLRDKLKTRGEAFSILERADVRETVENIHAAGQLLEDNSSLYKRLSQKSKEALKGRNLVERLEDGETFIEEYNQMVETLSGEVREEALLADKYLDVKGMQLMHKQMTILGKLSAKEEYYVPMELGGDLETVHLTIQSGSRDTGIVDMTVTLGDEKLQGHLEVTGEQVRGYLVAAGEKEVMISREAADIYREWIKDETEFRMDAGLYIVGSLTKKNVFKDGKQSAPETETERRPMNTQLYGLAKGFLQALTKAAERM